MHTLTITTNTADNANFLATFLKTVKIVKSVVIDKKSVLISRDTEVSEPAGEYNWTNPTRPATDEEFEQMILEAEKDEGYTIEQARKMTKKWIKENLK